MRCYLIRHGRDCETVRGGWSRYPLTDDGIGQANRLAQYFASNRALFPIQSLYSSDLVRAMQTAQILSKELNLRVTVLPSFREVNNGELAGMDHQLALQLYPGLFWNQLEWEQCYPNGESPRQFYNRISDAWESFSNHAFLHDDNIALVTHAGVIHVILSIIHGTEYSNRYPHRSIPYCGVIALEYEDGCWRETQITGSQEERE